MYVEKIRYVGSKNCFTQGKHNSYNERKVETLIISIAIANMVLFIKI